MSAASHLGRIADSLEKLTDRRPPRVGHSNPDCRQFNIVDFARAVRGPEGDLIAAFNKRVPDEYWSQDVRDAFPAPLPTAVISCPCGATPEAVAGKPVVCECERAFVFDGRSVRVAFSPEPNRPTPVES